MILWLQIASGFFAAAMPFRPARILAPDEVAVPYELFAAWRGLCIGSDWNKGTHAELYRGNIEKWMAEQAERMEGK